MINVHILSPFLYLSMCISPKRPQKICQGQGDVNLAGEAQYVETKSQEAAALI
jgi:hypothetical protein